jgi:hypothetical protein
MTAAGHAGLSRGALVVLVFTAAERPVFAVFCAAAVAALIALWAGAITI